MFSLLDLTILLLISSQFSSQFRSFRYSYSILSRTVCDDVKDVWRRAMGGELILKKREDGAGIVEG